jgi:hypothetical protein
MAGRLTGTSPLEAVRQSCRRVTEAAAEVTIDPEAVESLARELETEDLSPPPLDPQCHYLGKGEETVAFFLLLEAVNFGSGTFPDLMDHPEWQRNGYFATGGALARHFRQHDPLMTNQLLCLTEEESATLFGLDRRIPAAADLNRRFTAALNELGAHIEEHYQGHFTALVEAAEHSAVRLVELLLALPGFRDEASYRDSEGSFPVAFYKRAQITAADLALAFGGEGWGRFDDLDRLTCFADNQVPHVLRCDGVLLYSRELAEEIAAGREIASGSRHEVEIRAAAVTAVEALREALARRGRRVTSVQLDYRLWNRGLLPRYAEQPAHRTRTDFY